MNALANSHIRVSKGEWNLCFERVGDFSVKCLSNTQHENGKARLSKIRGEGS